MTHYATLHYTTQHNTTQHNKTQNNTIKYNTTQHNTSQNNTPQHNTTKQNIYHTTTQYKVVFCCTILYYTAKTTLLQHNEHNNVHHTLYYTVYCNVYYDIRTAHAVHTVRTTLYALDYAVQVHLLSLPCS